jgi:ABC-type lipoprotein release transport system permease subunit
VDPKAERAVFDLHRQLASGNFLEPIVSPDGRDRPMVLGAKLARSLNAAVGSEIVAVVQAGDGSLGNELFRVVGVLKTAGESLDRSAALITRQDFEELFVAPGVVHEIAINTRGRVPTEALGERLGAAVTKEDLRTWRQLLPSLAFMVNMYDVAVWIFAAIFLLAAGLGVLNTMLMATFERLREFGVQKALGTSPGRIVLGVIAEALLLSLVATGIGTSIALPLSYLLQANGLDMSALFSSFTAGGVAFDPIWYAAVSPRVVLNPVLAMWSATVLATLWPAVKAARILPVKAMTHV